MAKKAAEEGKITQKEAVKQAIAAGKDQPKDGVAYVKETFGMELSTGGFSTLKTQLKSAGKTPGKKKRGRPAGVSTSAPTPAPKKASMNGHMANPADLARGVKSLVEQFGAAAVTDMAKVFGD